MYVAYFSKQPVGLTPVQFLCFFSADEASASWIIRICIDASLAYSIRTVTATNYDAICSPKQWSTATRARRRLPPCGIIIRLFRFFHVDQLKSCLGLGANPDFGSSFLYAISRQRPHQSLPNIFRETDISKISSSGNQLFFLDLRNRDNQPLVGTCFQKCFHKLIHL